MIYIDNYLVIDTFTQTGTQSRRKPVYPTGNKQFIVYRVSRISAATWIIVGSITWSSLEINSSFERRYMYKIGYSRE